MNTEHVARLEQIFRAVFNLPEGFDVTKVRQVTHNQWDSLGHVSLVAAIESEFNLNIDLADSLRMTSFETTRVLLEEIRS